MERKDRNHYKERYPRISWDSPDIQYHAKPIYITVHAIKRARERFIAYPDQVYSCLQTGKVSTFGKLQLRFVKETENGSIICIGEERATAVIIKTVERGNER